MPSKSEAQHRLMECAAHSKGGCGGVSHAVGKEFVKADMDANIQGAGIMYVAGNQVLLGKRAKGDFAGYWAFPGGKTENGEAPLVTACRESFEEIGFVPQYAALAQIDYTDDGTCAFTTFLYRGAPFQIDMNDEHTEFRWCDFNALPSPIHPAVAITIQKYQSFAPTMDSARVQDINGWIEIKDNPISRVGVFPYLGKQVGHDFPPDQVVMVLRPEEELSDPAAIESFKLIPWIDEHVMLGPTESGMLPPEKKGIEGVIGENVRYENGKLLANIKVFSDNMDDLIEGGKRELSAGYRCFYEKSSGVWNGQRYDVIQRGIRGNHLALVTQGRMGPDVAVLDHMKFTFDAKDAHMPDTEKEKKEMMDAMTSAIKEMGDGLMKAVDAKFEAYDKKSKDSLEDDDDDKVAADAEEEKKKEEEKKAEDRKAMDAAIKAALDSALAPLTESIKGLQANGAKAFINEVKKRDMLATQLATYGVAVDGATDMTLIELQAAAVKSLGMKCEDGQAQIALDSYFHNRPSSRGNDIGFAIATDSKTTTNLADFFAKKAA